MFSQLIVAAVFLSVVICAVPAKTSNDRIVGGAPADISDYPYQVSITDYRGHFCGGSIIDRRRILTAAHCLYARAQLNPDYVLYIQVRIGSSNRSTGGIYRSIRKGIIHEKYNNKNIDNDIAVLILSNPIRFTPKSLPIALPKRDEDARANQTVFISGWGTQKYGTHLLPEILHSVAVNIIDQEACKLYYTQNQTNPVDSITENMLCAGIENIGGKDSCQGDSGGPLAEINEGNRILHGIVSWGYSCALPTHPGVYTRVSRYIDWIRRAF